MKKLAFTILFLLIPSVAFAQEAQPEPNAVAKVSDIALTIIVPILAALGGWLAMRLVRWLETRLHVNVSVEQEQRLRTVIADAVNFAAEQARKRVRANSDKLTGPEKLELAVGFATDMIEQYKLPDIARARLTNMLEARLNQNRAFAVEN